MATIITLSSSPPPIYARSPTPVLSSASHHKDLHSTHHAHDTSCAQFESAQTYRDGFSATFTTARQVLGPKPGAENVSFEPAKSIHSQSSRPACKVLSTSSRLSSNIYSGSGEAAQENGPPKINDSTGGTVLKILPSDVRRNRRAKDARPIILEKAVARRKDWTPKKSVVPQHNAPNTSTFGIDLAQSFGHDCGPSFKKPSSAVTEPSSKRRKIDPVSKPKQIPVINVTPSAKPGKAISKARSRSPAKKPLTITGLTTSYFVDDDRSGGNAAVLLQYLASTQAQQMRPEEDKDTFETAIVKKSNKSKQSNVRSRLRSPSTSMKTLAQQDFIFASASQFARDESPTLLRDTIEATKQSEECFMSDPFPTQQSAPISIESMSPKTGLSRYASRKGLWTAAQRDENNALLHHNDPFDNTAVRSALNGRDALVETTSALQPANDFADDSLDLLATLHAESLITYDIDEITTPRSPSKMVIASNNQTRAFSTSSRSPSSKRKKDTPVPSDNVESLPIKADPNPPKPTVPPKPNYGAWTDDELKRQIDDYGFKRLRARKTMIDKLDEMWAEKYGLDPATVKAATKAASKAINDRDHGHFLSKVHELSTRPTAKSKKPRPRTTMAEPLGVVTKRKTKSKLVEVSESVDILDDSIVDIDDIECTTAFDRLADIQPFADEPLPTLEPSTAPTKGTGVKAASKPKAKRKTKPQVRPLTPPPSMPTKILPDSSPGFESPRKASPGILSMTPISEMDGTGSSLRSHIRSALHHPAQHYKGRNHQKDPTWYEKTLMFDPIILEDFTAWLNTEGFNSIGIDDEIDAKDVKTWCEENGFCCLWKGGWRGNKVKE